MCLAGAACVVDAVAAEAPANLTATSPELWGLGVEGLGFRL